MAINKVFYERSNAVTSIDMTFISAQCVSPFWHTVTNLEKEMWTQQPNARPVTEHILVS